MQDNKEVILTAIIENNLSFEYASERLKMDKEIILTALNGRAFYVGRCTSNGDSLSPLAYVPDSLKTNREIIITALKNNPNAISYVPKEFLNDKEILITALKSSTEQKEAEEVLTFIPDKLKDDKEFIVEIIKGNYDTGYWGGLGDGCEVPPWPGYIILSVASTRIKEDKNFIMAAVQIAGEALEFASPKLQADKEVVMKAVATKVY
ncbi:MAG: DUF4116 domain-containing protein [bacterium]